MQYGDLRLQFVSQTGGDDKALGASAGFDFGVAALAPQAESDRPQTNIKRTFKLWHKDSPANVRTVSQIQCVAWPDFDVPESPEILLRLMCDVDEAVEELCGGGVDRCSIPPVLVHCSAGIGRTGSYILADAVTDGLRRERRDAPLKRPPLVTAPESQASMPQVVSPTRVKTPEKMDIDLPVETEARAASAPV
jgi:protein-tyrosine phosphatase